MAVNLAVAAFEQGQMRGTPRRRQITSVGNALGWLPVQVCSCVRGL